MQQDPLMAIRDPKQLTDLAWLQSLDIAQQHDGALGGWQVIDSN